ncbi:MAG: PEGA domain-containing protein [Microgenomates group bacterium]
MKKILLILFATIFLGGCTPKDLFVKPPSGLEISSNPTSTVFINGVSRGETPFSDKNMKPGNYTLKLIPVGGDGLSPYETNINLVSEASTIISRNFAQSELDASGYTLQLQEDVSGGTYLSTISDPDNVNINIDDVPRGFTPVSKLAISPGSHTLFVTSPGYIDQTLPVNTVKGFNLIVNFKLASQTINLSANDTSPSPSPSAASSASPSASPKPSVISMATPYVVVNETGTGWLRIRKEASGSSDELGKANTGEKLKYLGESTELGWFKIEFEGAAGWVSGKYVTLVK